jgi:Zn-dependent oligopeptidase
LKAQARERIKAIGERLAVLATQFSQNVLADEQVEALHITDKADLAGLSSVAGCLGRRGGAGIAARTAG